MLALYLIRDVGLEKTTGDEVVIAASQRKGARLERVGTAFASTNPDDLFHRHNKNFAVADTSGASGALSIVSTTCEANSSATIISRI